jgi:DNA-binding NarL/FixJ family response regulator
VQQIVAFNPHVKVVVVLGSDDRDVMQEAFHRGACGCVVRSRDGSDLPDAIWRVLAGAAYEEDPG